MKKKIAIVLTAALLTFPVSAGVVMASTTTVTAANEVKKETPVLNAYGKIVKAGILTNSSFAWLDKIIERIQVAVEFDSTKKAQKIIEQASERLAEAAELAKNNDDEGVEEALDLYTQKIEQAQELLDTKVKEDKEKGITALTSEQQATLYSLTATKVNTNNITVLAGLLDKLPPQAAKKVYENIKRSLEKAVEKVDRIDNKLEEADKDKESKVERVKESKSEKDNAKLNDSKKLSQEAKKALIDLRNAYGQDKDAQEKDDQEKAKKIESTSAFQPTELEEPVTKKKQTLHEQSQTGKKSEEKKFSLKQADINDDDNANKDK